MSRQDHEDLKGISHEPRELLAARANPKDIVGMSKVDVTVVPVSAVYMEALAFMDGAYCPKTAAGLPYGPYNWRDNPVQLRSYIAAARRHIDRYLEGEQVNEKGVHELACARACLGILIDAEVHGSLIDDRPKKRRAFGKLLDLLNEGVKKGLAPAGINRRI